MTLLIGVIVALALSFHRGMDAIQKRVVALYRIEAKLDLLLKQANIKYEAFGGLPSNIVDALNSGKKIEAIKLYRKMNGTSLREAKDFIEEVQRRSSSAN